MCNVQNPRERPKTYSMRENGGQVSAGCRHPECWLRQNSVMIFSSEMVPAEVRASSAGAEAWGSSEVAGGSFQVILPPEVAERGRETAEVAPTVVPDCACVLVCAGVCCVPERETVAVTLRRGTDCRKGCCEEDADGWMKSCWQARCFFEAEVGPSRSRGGRNDGG